MVYSKSDILALLQRWAAAPSASFANKSLIGGRRTLHSHIAEGIGKETAEQLVAAVGRGAFARLLELNLADNAMGTAIAAELLTALQSGACPQLRTLVPSWSECCLSSLHEPPGCKGRSSHWWLSS